MQAFRPQVNQQVKHRSSIVITPAVTAICRRRCELRVRAAASHEYSSRVKGDVGRVYEYVANFQNLPQWYPGECSWHS